MVKEKKWFVVSRKEKVAEDIWKSPDLTEPWEEKRGEKRRDRGVGKLTREGNMDQDEKRPNECVVKMTE